MPTDLPIRCRCGALHGVAADVSPRNGNHAVCYCDDCQLYALFLGNAQALLDRHGGTEVFQMSQGRLRITHGQEHLACVRLRDNGLLRWYAGCCDTPIGNTMPGRAMPFLGLVLACAAADASTGSLDACVGPVRARVNGRHSLEAAAVADPAIHHRIPPGNLLRVLALLLRWRFRGDAARSPFFDPASGKTVVRPRVLDAAQLEHLRATFPVASTR